MRWLWALPAALLGGAVSVVGVLVHRNALWVGGWPLPWAALLALAAAVALAVALSTSVSTLLGFLLGWVTPVLLALGEGPGGDFVLLSDLLGWGYLIASVLVVAVALPLGAGAARHRDPAARGARAEGRAGQSGRSGDGRPAS